MSYTMAGYDLGPHHGWRTSVVRSLVDRADGTVLWLLADAEGTLNLVSSKPPQPVAVAPADAIPLGTTGQRIYASGGQLDTEPARGAVGPRVFLPRPPYGVRDVAELILDEAGALTVDPEPEL